MAKAAGRNQTHTMVREGKTLQLRHWVIRVAGQVPVLMPVGLASFGVVAMLLLVANVFYLPLLLIIGLPATVGAMWLARGVAHYAGRPGSERSKARADVLVVLGILMWVGLNVPFAAQHIRTDRDPATYAVAGAWLSTHSDLHIPKPAELSSLPGMTADSLGFDTSVLNPNEIYVQGAHLLPALLGTVGKILGTTAMLHFNVVFGGIALLAFYGFVRVVLKPKWAALSVAALALSLPFIYFSRDTYTEPLTLMLIFSTLALLLYASRLRTLSPWIIAGMTAGATALVRIDAYVFLAALEVYMASRLIIALPRERTAQLRQAAALALPAVAVAFLGWVDVSQLSSGYYRDLHPEIVAQFYFIAAITVVLVAAIAVAWKIDILSWFRRQAAHLALQRGIIVAIALFFIILGIRATWLFAMAVTGRADTMPVEAYARGTTMLWLLWYIGPLLTLAGIAGFAYGWTHLLRGKAGQLLPLFLALGADCALYLLNPNISADQVWASRRFLPIIFPAFIIIGVLVLQHASQYVGARFGRLQLTRRAIVLAALVAVAGPSLASLPFWTLRPFAELSQTEALCKQLPKNAVVVWVGQEGGFATQPTQAFCGVESLSTTDSGQSLALLASQLATVAAAQGKTLFFGTDGSEASLLSASMGVERQVGNLTYAEPEHTYKKFPIHTITHTQSLILVPIDMNIAWSGLSVAKTTD